MPSRNDEITNTMIGMMIAVGVIYLVSNLWTVLDVLTIPLIIFGLAWAGSRR